MNINNEIFKIINGIEYKPIDIYSYTKGLNFDKLNNYEIGKTHNYEIGSINFHESLEAIEKMKKFTLKGMKEYDPETYKKISDSNLDVINEEVKTLLKKYGMYELYEELTKLNEQKYILEDEFMNINKNNIDNFSWSVITKDLIRKNKQYVYPFDFKNKYENILLSLKKVYEKKNVIDKNLYGSTVNNFNETVFNIHPEIKRRINYDLLKKYDIDELLNFSMADLSNYTLNINNIEEISQLNNLLVFYNNKLKQDIGEIYKLKEKINKTPYDYLDPDDKDELSDIIELRLSYKKSSIRHHFYSDLIDINNNYAIAMLNSSQLLDSLQNINKFKVTKELAKNAYEKNKREKDILSFLDKQKKLTKGTSADFTNFQQKFKQYVENEIKEKTTDKEDLLKLYVEKSETIKKYEEELKGKIIKPNQINELKEILIKSLKQGFKISLIMSPIIIGGIIALIVSSVSISKKNNINK